MDDAEDDSFSLFFVFLFWAIMYARIIPDNVLIYFSMNNKKCHDDTIIYLSNSVMNPLCTYASVCLHLHSIARAHHL